MRIIIFNGQGGCGKTTTETILTDIAKKNGRKSYIDSIINPIKNIAAECFGWNGNKTNKDRKFLSDLKVISTEYNDFCYRCLISTLQILTDSEDIDFFLVDMREKSDIERIKRQFSDDVVTVLVTRGKNKTYGNIADDNVSEINYDYIIDNKGTIDELRENIEALYDGIRGID